MAIYGVYWEVMIKRTNLRMNSKLLSLLPIPQAMNSPKKKSCKMRKVKRTWKLKKAKEIVRPKSKLSR